MYKIEIEKINEKLTLYAKDLKEVSEALKNINAISVRVNKIDEITYKIETLIQHKTKNELYNLRNEFVNAYMIQKDEYQVRALQRIDERLKENDEQ